MKKFFHEEFYNLNEDLLKSFCDPITMEVMIDPVIAMDGITYERNPIQKWFKSCRSQNKAITSPVTNMILTSDQLISNIVLKNILDSTIKYLQFLHSQNVLEGHGLEILAKYQESEQLIKERYASAIKEEQISQQMIVKCKLGHQMVYHRKYMNPISSTGSSQPVSLASSPRIQNLIIKCQICDQQHLSQQCSYYFHCTQCNVNLCDVCSEELHDTEQYHQRAMEEHIVVRAIHQLLNNNQANQEPTTNIHSSKNNNDGSITPRRLRRGHAFFISRSSTSDETDGSLSPLSLRSPHISPLHVRHVQLSQHQQPSFTGVSTASFAITNTTSMLSNTNNSNYNNNSNSTILHAPHSLCPTGHRMDAICNGLPPDYRGTFVYCDDCQELSLQNHPQGYLHCSQCRYDRCYQCAFQEHTCDLSNNRLTTTTTTTTINTEMVTAATTSADMMTTSTTNSCFIPPPVPILSSTIPLLRRRRSAELQLHSINTTTMVNDRIQCKKGHGMKLYRGNVPKGFVEINCDQCLRASLQRDNEGYVHCVTCKFDLCFQCMASLSSLSTTTTH
jgi:hypothetical protein